MANRPRQRQYFHVYQDTLCELAKDRDLTGVAFRVLAYMLSEMIQVGKFDNAIHLTQARIARELNIDPSAVSVQINKFIEKGIFERIPLKQKAKGRGTSYRLSKKIGWKGYAHQEDEEQAVSTTDDSPSADQ